jgi:hypothetical protein
MSARTVFILTPNANKTQWTETVLYSFCAQPNFTDGANPYWGLTMDPAGNLYGVTNHGGGGAHVGNGADGTVYALRPNADKTQWTHTVLYNFCDRRAAWTARFLRAL